MDSHSGLNCDIRQFVEPTCGRDSTTSATVVGNLESSSSFTHIHQRESTPPAGEPLNSTMIKQQLEAMFPQVSQEVIMQAVSTSQSVAEAIDKLLQPTSGSVRVIGKDKYLHVYCIRNKPVCMASYVTISK